MAQQRHLNTQSSFDLWGEDQNPKEPPSISPPPKFEFSLGFTPSSYHWPIFQFGQEPQSGNALIDACPGSGKSTTIIEFARILPPDQSILVVAFSKHIADELQPRLRRSGLAHRSHSRTGKRLVEARTIHSFGLDILRRNLLKGKEGKLSLEESKYDKLTREYLATRGLSARDYQLPVTELVRLAQLTLTDPENEEAMRELALHYNLVEAFQYWETVYFMAKHILEQGKELAQDKHIINFEDMLWLPSVLKLAPRERYDWVLVDEYQDLSRAQLEIVLNCATPQGRFLFVGDHHQSIFGFNCAEIGIKELILERTAAREFPLPITYRCPRTHVALAREVYSGIQTGPDAKPGEVLEIELAEVVGEVRAGDLVICRTTAPLISLCFELLRQGVQARVRGRDIGRSLVAILTPLEKAELAGKFVFDLENFLGWLEIEEEKGVAQAERAVNVGASPTTPELVKDKFQTIKAIYLTQANRPQSAQALKKLILSLFSDTTAAVWLSTIHRAKGLEAKRVFFLKPELLPHPMATLGWEKVQEMNCKYVAVTRAKQTLYFVTDNSERKEADKHKQNQAVILSDYE